MRTKEEIKKEIEKLKLLNDKDPDDSRKLLLTSARFAVIKYLQWVLSESEENNVENN